MAKKIVYIAGPITNGGRSGHTIENLRPAIDMAELLLIEGYIPIVPHLAMIWQLIYPHDYMTWIKYSMEFVRIADCVLRLKGESAGADDEVELAKSLGKPVYYSFAELLRGEQ